MKTTMLFILSCGNSPQSEETINFNDETPKMMSASFQEATKIQLGVVKDWCKAAA
jgi:ABC-type lipoprotein export system ATPase subunit